MELYLVVFLVISVIFMIMTAAGTATATAPGRALQEKFLALGQMPGKSKDEIIAAVGKPNSISATPEGMLLQWQAPGYHIAIRFKDDIFDGVMHEFAN